MSEYEHAMTKAFAHLLAGVLDGHAGHRLVLANGMGRIARELLAICDREDAANNN